MVICLIKASSGTCWHSLLTDNWKADPLVFDQMERKLTLQRLQVENPGMDFSSADISGNYHNGGPKFPNVDKILLNRTFVRSSVLETLKCPETSTDASPNLNDLNLSGQEVRNFYESLTQCVTEKQKNSSLDPHFYHCSVCGGSFNDFKQHVSSIGHQVAEISKKGSKPSPLLIPPSNKGYQLLTRIGWRDAALDPEYEELKTSEILLTGSTNESKAHSCNKDGGLGASRQGRRFPVATVLKRDRLGFGWPNRTNTSRITHFNPGDFRAVEHPKDVKRFCHSSIKMDSKYLIRKMNSEKKKERIIRQGFNLTDEQLALLYEK